MSSVEYVNAASGSDLFEIQEGQLALTQSQNPRVRSFADMMVRDHGLTTQTLTGAIQRSGITAPPPPSLLPEQQQMLGALQSQRGADFDRAYVKQQVMAHQEALTVQTAYAQGGADSNLRAAAQSAVPMVRRHLEEARQILTMMGGM